MGQRDKKSQRKQDKQETERAGHGVEGYNHEKRRSMDSRECWRTSVELSIHDRIGSVPMLFGLKIQSWII